MEKYFKQFEACRQKEEPACTNTCPFHLDVKDFLEKTGRNKYDRAYKNYRDAVVFPEIVSKICDARCQNACPRTHIDDAVQIRLLEETCVNKARKKEPLKYNLPKKQGKIGIIGGGLSGLTCGLRLATKKYSVVIFEKEKIPGGQLKYIMDEAEYLAAIDLQMSKEEYELLTDTEIAGLDSLAEYGFDAVYIATGQGGNDFGMTDLPAGQYSENNKFAVWCGGSLKGKSLVEAIVDGANAAMAIDLYIKTGSGNIAETAADTRIVPDLKKIVKCERVVPTESGIFSDEEAAAESARCIRCQCNSCQESCDLVAYYNKWPAKMREEVAETVMESGSMLRKSPATYLVNSCTQCGLFEQGCPSHIDMKGMMLETRRVLHRQKQMPPAFHGFWLDDMHHANGERSHICRNAHGSESSEYAFFPGCNLGASRPELVEAAYGWLNSNFENMGLMLRCCGIHAEWAGDEALAEQLKTSLVQDWTVLGKPVLITACPSCARFLTEALPEIKSISLPEFICSNGIYPDMDNNIAKGREFAVFDPCAARENHNMQDAVRKILNKKNIKFFELEQKGNYGCCGFGGDISVANPEIADFIAEKRADMTQAPYITYCINCRDVFADRNKEAVHILDVLFGDSCISGESADFTARRRNREMLKKKMLETYWGEQMINDESKYGFEIIYDDNIKQKIKKLHLVEEDIKEVIYRADNLNRRIYNADTEEYTCYSKLNYITCWVSYKVKDDKYCLTNVYTHRMNIKLEEVWNGKKINADL